MVPQLYIAPARERASPALPAGFAARTAAAFARLFFFISAFLLYLLFFWRRSITLFDHVIFAAHSLSFQGFFVSLVALSSAILHEGTIHTLLLISPLHLYKHMRVAYGCSRIATLTRMGLLFAGTVLGFSFLLLLLLILGLNDLHG